MATKEQYEFFQFLYQEEDRRYAELESRGRFYLSIVAIFLASLLFKVEEVRASAAALSLPWWMVLAEALFLALTLLFVVIGALIRTYEGVTDPDDVIGALGKAPPANEEFFDDRIADYAVATKRNAAVNDRTATYLQISGVTLALAMAVLVAMLAVALYG